MPADEHFHALIVAVPTDDQSIAREDTDHRIGQDPMDRDQLVTTPTGDCVLREISEPVLSAFHRLTRAPSSWTGGKSVGGSANPMIPPENRVELDVAD